MRKVIFIAMAALTLLTAQCKKNEPKPEEKVMVPITGSVDFGGSKTEITMTGYITPVDGDMIYIYDNGSNVGSMRCTPTTGQQFTCSGTIQQTSIGNECTFMYLGSNNGTNGDSESISFADQTGVSVSDGKIANLNKFHVGSCQAQVSSEGTVTLPMVTKMSIAYFCLTDGTNPIANQDVTISGVSATANINKTDGTLTGVAGDITVHTDAQGKFYMALVPQSGEVTFSFAVEGYENATNVFPYGIRECSFYSNEGSGSPLQVTVTPKPKPKFSVGENTSVEFSPGNLYWDGTESKFKFEANQWSTTPASNGTWDANHVSHFFWSKTASVAYASSYSDSGASTDDVFFTNATEMTANPDFQVSDETAGTWRTLSKAEWSYLIGESDPGRDQSLCKWSAVTFSESGPTVSGLIIMPDDWEGTLNATTDYTAWQSLETSGAVFLPAAGFRYGTDVYYVGSRGYYWSGTPNEGSEANAYSVYFGSGYVRVNYDHRYVGSAVRLVR